jgi:hypothetical protein
MRRFVEGVDRGQRTLFPECLEDWIDEGNPVPRPICKPSWSPPARGGDSMTHNRWQRSWRTRCRRAGFSVRDINDAFEGMSRLLRFAHATGFQR